MCVCVCVYIYSHQVLMTGLAGNSPDLFDLDGKEFASNAGDLGSIPELGRSPGEGNSSALQYSCMENSMDRGAWLDRGAW